MSEQTITYVGEPLARQFKDKIEANKKNIADEVDRATSKEAALETAITAEAKRATEVEGILGEHIVEEMSRATAVEANLQSEINTIHTAQNCVDIVSTYSELQELDTSILNDNDKVEVLRDELHEDSTYVYRLSKSESGSDPVWEPVGQMSVIIDGNTFVAVLELTSADEGNGPSAAELRAAKTAGKAIIVKCVEDSTTVYSAAIIEDDGTNLGVIFTMGNEVFTWSVNGTRWIKQTSFKLVEDADNDGVIYGRRNGRWVEVAGGSDKVFVIEYEQTTFTELKSAYDAGKVMFMSLGYTTPIPASVDFYEGEDPADNDEFVIMVESDGMVGYIILDEDGWSEPEVTYLVEEAPEDGNLYARKDGDWEEISIPEVVTVEPEVTDYFYLKDKLDSGASFQMKFGHQIAPLSVMRGSGQRIIMQVTGSDPDELHPILAQFAVNAENEWTSENVSLVPEAPNDGKQYTRQNKTWVKHEDDIVLTRLVSTHADAVSAKTAFENGKPVTVSVGGVRYQCLDMSNWGETASISMHYLDVSSASNYKVCEAIVNPDNSWTIMTNSITGISDAPKDNKTYGRNNGAWVEVETVEEAPEDHKQYARQDGSWVEVEGGGGSAMTRFAHWGNETGWQLPDTAIYKYKHTDTQLLEGDLTDNPRPHAPAGIYHFDAEVTFLGEIQTDDFVKYDAAIKYGKKVLREISLVNDNSWPAKDLECVHNHHFSGVFKLDDEGDIDLVLTKGDGGPDMKVKFSHLFLYKLGDI